MCAQEKYKEKSAINKPLPLLLHSGVTTMGSDRANPGAPNQNGPNGSPQAQAVEQKHWPGPLICHNVVF
jgi:hypothetical protein